MTYLTLLTLIEGDGVLCTLIEGRLRATNTDNTRHTISFNQNISISKKKRNFSSFVLFFMVFSRLQVD